MFRLLQSRLADPSVRADPRAAAALWERGFRPFFLGVGVYGALIVLVWVAVWIGLLSAPRWLAPPWWHGHEMVFGLVAGAVAGFLLTAVPTWTGRPAPPGRPLAALFALWVAGRLAMLASGVLPGGLVAAVDLAFLPALVVALARLLWRSGQPRNYGLLALVGLLALANVAVHADALGVVPGAAPRALRFAVDAIVVLIVVIGGRITPVFTVNALRRAGLEASVVSRPWLARGAVGAAALLALSDLVAPRSAVSGALGGAAALLVATRMAGWHTRRALRDPLVLSLHAGMAWVAVGLGLVAWSDLGGPVPATAGLHALTAGAVGAEILAVMTRVALGHTGRPLVAPAGVPLAYGLVHAGALLRVTAAFGSSAFQPMLVGIAGVSWAAAFGLFAAIYAPILWGPRVDEVAESASREDGGKR